MVHHVRKGLAIEHRARGEWSFASTVRKQRVMGADASLSFTFCSFWDSAHRLVLHTFSSSLLHSTSLEMPEICLLDDSASRRIDNQVLTVRVDVQACLRCCCYFLLGISESSGNSAHI